MYRTLFACFTPSWHAAKHGVEDISQNESTDDFNYCGNAFQLTNVALYYIYIYIATHFLDFHFLFNQDVHAFELWKSSHCFVNLKMRVDGVKPLFDFLTVACFPSWLFNRRLMNTLLPLHSVDLSSLFSPLGDVLWRFPEFWCSLLCISFLWEDKRASSPTWTTMALPESFTEKWLERRARISPLLLPSIVSLVDNGVAQVLFHLNNPYIPPLQFFIIFLPYRR